MFSRVHASAPRPVKRSPGTDRGPQGGRFAAITSSKSDAAAKRESRTKHRLASLRPLHLLRPAVRRLSMQAGRIAKIVYARGVLA